MTNFSATLAKSCSYKRSQNRRNHQNRTYWAERFLSAYWISLSTSVRMAIWRDKVKSRCEPVDRNKLPKWLTRLVQILFWFRSWEHKACVSKGLKTIKVIILIFTLFRRYCILVLYRNTCHVLCRNVIKIQYYDMNNNLDIIWPISYDSYHMYII